MPCMRRRWAIEQCRQFFGLSEADERLIRGHEGRSLCLQRWRQDPATFDDDPLTLLRQEWFHAADLRYKHPGFFAVLPPVAVILDYGCGTGEVARLPWIARHERIVLVDHAPRLEAYLYAKYAWARGVRICDVQDPAWAAFGPYDGLICTDMFEHIVNPLEVQAGLWGLLKPGGHALLKFEDAYPHAGHLAESIAQLPAWWTWVQAHAEIIEVDTYIWARKTT